MSETMLTTQPEVTEDVEVGVESTTVHFPVRVTMLSHDNAPFDFKASVDEVGNIILTPTTKDMEFTDAQTEWENQDYVMPVDDSITTNDSSVEKTVTIELTANMLSESENKHINADIDEIGQCVIYPAEENNSFISVSIEDSLNLVTTDNTEVVEEDVKMDTEIKTDVEQETETPVDEHPVDVAAEVADNVEAEVIEETVSIPEQDDAEPYDFAAVEHELRLMTHDWTDTEGSAKCSFVEEKDSGVEILSKHYNNVTVEEVGDWFYINYSDPITSEPETIVEEKILKEDKQSLLTAIADLEGQLNDIKATLDDLRQQVSMSESLTEDLDEVTRHNIIDRFMKGDISLFSDDGTPEPNMEHLSELDADNYTYYYDAEADAVVSYIKVNQ